MKTVEGEFTLLNTITCAHRRGRWVVKRDEDESIVEVKMIYDPKNYETFKKSKPMVGDKKLVEILDNEYEKKKNNS